MYENIKGLLDLDAEQKLKIAIVGEPKTGKSWLALTAPGPIFVAEFDGREESIKQYLKQSKRTDITAKHYKDIDPNKPRAVAQLEVDLAMFEYLKEQKKEIPVTFVLDSVTFLRICCENELMAHNSKLSHSLKLGVKEIKVSQGYDIVNGNKAYLDYLFTRFAALGNLIIVFHELDESDKALSTKEEKKYTGRKTIKPQYLSDLLSTVNDVFRITVDYTGKRIVAVKPNSEFIASTSMSLSDTEEPDIQAMIAKSNKNTVAKS